MKRLTPKPKEEINPLIVPARNLIGNMVEQAVTNLANQIIANTIEGTKQAIDGKHFMRRLSK